MITKLQLYNNALVDIGERMLATLSENREPRRLLDLAWDSGATAYCLELGLWNFAMRSTKLDYSPSVEPPWGYRRAFDKASDYVRTAAVCSDEYFRAPLLAYVDEADFWFADLDTIYVRYVSSDAAYGANMGRWPQSFQSLISAYLANEIVDKVTQDPDRIARAAKRLKDRLDRARSNDAMNQPTAIPPPSRWTRARLGQGGGTRSDGGNNGSLIG